MIQLVWKKTYYSRQERRKDDKNQIQKLEFTIKKVLSYILYMKFKDKHVYFIEIKRRTQSLILFFSIILSILFSDNKFHLLVLYKFYL